MVPALDPESVLTRVRRRGQAANQRQAAISMQEQTLISHCAGPDPGGSETGFHLVRAKSQMLPGQRHHRSPPSWTSTPQTRTRPQPPSAASMTPIAHGYLILAALVT